MKKYATFFGGAINDRTTQQYSDSILIGELLAKNGYIVKSGGYRGLMEAVSKGAKESNGEVIGYTCLSIGPAKGNKYLTQTIPCDDIYSRLKKLVTDSDIFIVQRGGIGTLSEVFLLLDEERKMKIKPNIYIFGNELYSLFKNLSDFITDEQKSRLLFCEDFNEFKSLFNSKQK